MIAGDSGGNAELIEKTERLGAVADDSEWTLVLVLLSYLLHGAESIHFKLMLNL